MQVIPHDGESMELTEAPRLDNTSVFLDTRDEDLAAIEVALQAIILFFAIFGNSCVLIALRYRKKKTSRMHLFIMHLSVADLLVAFLNILPQLAWDATFRFQGSDALCRLVKYLQVMAIYLSTYILVMTAIDRYRAICYPLSNYSWATKKSHMMIGIAYLISGLFSIPQAFIFTMQEVHPGTGIYDCWANFKPVWTLKAYVTYFCLFVYIIPFLLISVLYGRICYEVSRNVSRCESKPAEHCRMRCGGVGRVTYKFTGTGHIAVIPENKKKRNLHKSDICTRRHSSLPGSFSRSKMKTIKLTFVVIIAYLVCWSPFIIAQMWWAYDEEAPYNHATFVICLLLASLNSCCNPWIYMAFSGSLLQQILPCCRKRTKAQPPFPRNWIREQRRSSKTDSLLGGECRRDCGRLDDVPLRNLNIADDCKRKRSLCSRTSSTKLTQVRDPGLVQSRGNGMIRYSRENGIVAIQFRAKTKNCDCKNCRKHTADDREYCSIFSRRDTNSDSALARGQDMETRNLQAHSQGFLPHAEDDIDVKYTSV